MTTIRVWGPGVGQSYDTARLDIETTAWLETLHRPTLTKVILLFANTYRTTGHWIPIMNWELISWYFINESHAFLVAIDITKITNMALNLVNITMVFMSRVVVVTDGQTPISQVSKRIDSDTELFIWWKSCPIENKLFWALNISQHIPVITPDTRHT